MNDQTSPTADGQGPGSSPWRNPFEEPQSAQGLPRVPDLVPGGAGGPAGQGGYGGGGGGGGDTFGGWRGSLVQLLIRWRSDLLAATVLTVTGAVLGVLAGLAWYRFAPTVWLTLPASAVSQVTSAVDQSSLLVEPEAKGIASVDGYYFMITAAVGLLLGILGFFLARRGLAGERDPRTGEPDGAAVGAWAGVLLGGLAASTAAAAIGRWVSMPDPMTVLHTIAAGHNFHAPVALHAQGLYLAAPVLGLVLFLALTVAFTKPLPPPRQDYGAAGGYFTSDNPYGFAQTAQPQQPQQSQPQPQQPPPGGNGGPDATPGASSGAGQADTSLG